MHVDDLPMDADVWAYFPGTWDVQRVTVLAVRRFPDDRVFVRGAGGEALEALPDQLHPTRPAALDAARRECEARAARERETAAYCTDRARALEDHSDRLTCLLIPADPAGVDGAVELGESGAG